MNNEKLKNSLLREASRLTIAAASIEHELKFGEDPALTISMVVEAQKTLRRMVTSITERVKNGKN